MYKEGKRGYKKTLGKKVLIGLKSHYRPFKEPIMNVGIMTIEKA